MHPMHFLFLLNEKSQRSAMKVRAGLWLYQRIAGKSARAASEIELKQLERALDSGHRWSLFNYEDAQCEFPERLVAEWLREAVEAMARRFGVTPAVLAEHPHALIGSVPEICDKLEALVIVSWPPEIVEVMVTLAAFADSRFNPLYTEFEMNVLSCASCALKFADRIDCWLDVFEGLEASIAVVPRCRGG